MLELLNIPGAIVAAKVTGRLSGDDCRRWTSALDAKLLAHDRLALYADLSGMRTVGADAWAQGLRLDLHAWKPRRFTKLALVSDSASLRTVALLVGALLPGIEVRSYSASDGEAALMWARSVRTEGEPERALRWLESSGPDVYAFAWNGVVTPADIESFVRRLTSELESHLSVRLLARIEYMAGVRPRALLEPVLWRLKLKALGVRKIERYAVVGGPAWLPRYISAVKRVTGVDIRHYPADREEQARSWLHPPPTADEGPVNRLADAPV